MLTKPSILVVDDSLDGRRMLAAYLASRKFPVAEAQNGREAIEVAHRLQPSVILMDLSMPVVDGWEATRQLKADPLTKNITIIALTAHAFPPEQEAARVAGCDAVIPKPYDLTVLANALDRVFSKRITALDPEAVALKAACRHRRKSARPV
jgi:CheY-like chemotaxis protein